MITTRRRIRPAPRPFRAAPSPDRAEERIALAALGFILAVTAAWWWLALGPWVDTAPRWLHAARAICFGTRENGLPDAGGWILLVGEPLLMLSALLLTGWAPLASGIRRMATHALGRHPGDARTGQVAHLPLTFVVDTAGGSARRTTGALDEIVRAAGAREGPGPS